MGLKLAEFVKVTKIIRALQCKHDLKSDEEIFLEKNREIKELQERVAELVSRAFLRHNNRMFTFVYYHIVLLCEGAHCVRVE